MDNIQSADLAGIQLISFIVSVIPSKDKKYGTITKVFQKIVKELNHKPNNIGC